MSNRYAALDDLKDDLRDRIDSSAKVAAALERRYVMSWIYHDNALEGLVLSEPEIVQALEAQVVADASLLQVITLIRNHQRALEVVRAEAGSKTVKISIPLLRTLFETLQAGIGAARSEAAPEAKPDPKALPMLRKEMPLHRTYYHDISQPSKILPELQNLVEFSTSAEFREFHPIKQATWVHWQFMQTFPFSDHNGRIARLLGNLFLARAGYPPAIIHAIDRQKYYDALRLPVATLRTVLLDAIENSLQNAVTYARQLRTSARRAASE